MAKISRYTAATDGNPVDWLVQMAIDYEWDWWIKINRPNVIVGMNRGMVENSSSAAIGGATPADLNAAVKAALETLTDEMVTDLQDLAS